MSDEEKAREILGNVNRDWMWGVDAMEIDEDDLRQMIAQALTTARREALEEAAKVAERLSDEWDEIWRNEHKCSSHLEGKSDGANEIATAIRALMEGEG